MAYTTGEAANHLDMLVRLRDYLVSNGWAQVGGQTGAVASGDFVSLSGPGLSGTDQILLTVQAFTNAPAGVFSLRMSGHTAYNPALPTIDPPGLNSPWVYAPLVNDRIRYWIVVNGRRFILIAKVNNRYDVFYGGFILPEHLPSDWSYPFLIGGSANAYMQSSVDTVHHRNFWSGYNSGYLFTPSQVWRAMNNYRADGFVQPLSDALSSIDWRQGAGLTAYTRTLDDQPWISRGRIAEFFDGDAGSPRNMLGHYDGVFYTPAAGAVIESLIEHGGKQYLVVPNVYRTSDLNVAAICLE